VTLQGTGGLILFHAEIGDPVQGLGQDQSYQTFLRSRPDQWEVTAIESIIRLLQEQAASEEAAKATRAHIVHLATAQALPMIAKARSDGLPLTTETCFHYLVLSSDAVPAESDKHHTEYKCCPPIREESNRELLWQALENGLIDYVVSDHSPCTPDLKQGGFMDAWGGISALGLGVSLLWTEICKRNALREKQRLEGPLRTLSDLVRWCCVNTAEQVGLKGRKGTITKGADADLIVFDPNARFTVSNQPSFAIVNVRQAIISTNTIFF
jgi:allantoinase